MSIETKEEKLRNLRDQQASIASAIRKAEQDLQLAKKARESEPPEGTKILITVKFPGSTTEYEYLGLRTAPDKDNPDARWYITGRSGKLTWDYVLRLIERGDYKVHYLTFLRL